MKNTYWREGVIANTLMRIFAVSKNEENRVALQQEIAEALCWEQNFLIACDLLLESNSFKNECKSYNKNQLETPEWSTYFICECITNLISADDINRWCSAMKLDFNVVWIENMHSYVVFRKGVYIMTTTFELSQPQGEQQNG